MKRKFLIVIRAGKKSLHHEWLDSEIEPRLWDLQISQYDDCPDVGIGSDFPVSVDKGTKWDSINRFLAGNTDILERYDYIMFPDDDIRSTCSDINRMFETCEKHDLDLAQPSLHADSYICYQILSNNKWAELRYTNFIECMAPIISTSYLKAQVISEIQDVRSGYGMDFVWALWMPDPKYKAAIIDSVSIVHTRPHATGATGSIYRQFEGGVAPVDEGRNFLANYSGVPNRIIAYASINKSGRRLGSISTKIAMGVYMIFNAHKHRSKWAALKTGIGSLIRIVTAFGYKPKRVNRRSGSDDLLGKPARVRRI